MNPHTKRPHTSSFSAQGASVRYGVGVKQKYKSGAGFTLVEILVVVAVIFILSLIILPNYRSSTSQFTLARSAHKLAQDIRRVSEMAMSAKELPGGVMPAGGYGIFFDVSWDNKKYRLYADTQPPGGNEFFTAADTIVEPPYIELEKGVVIQSINTPANKVGINFKPPAPTVKIKYSATDEVGTVIITLALESDPTKTKTIKINKAGLIDVE